MTCSLFRLECLDALVWVYQPSCFLEQLFSILLSQSLNLSLKPPLMQMHITMAATTTKVMVEAMEDMVEVITMVKEMLSLKLILKPTTTIVNAPTKATDILRDTDTTRGLQNLMLRLK